MKVIDVASAILGHDKIDVIGVRLGEKIHEQMISAEDSLTTYAMMATTKFCLQLITGI